MSSQTRAQRLLDEFHEGATTAAGLARVLRHIADTESDPESFHAVPENIIYGMADALERIDTEQPNG